MCNEKQEMEKKVKSLYTGVCKKPLKPQTCYSYINTANGLMKKEYKDTTLQEKRANERKNRPFYK